ncbi:MAG: NAD(P)-dependent oxidoreductase [Acidobacteriota bacterium]
MSLRGRVLLTGATGFLGRPTLAALRALGFAVEAVTRRADDPRARAAGDDPHVRWHALDLLDPRAARALVDHLRPDAVVHCAWHLAPGGRFYHDKTNLRWVEATLGLLRACDALPAPARDTSPLADVHGGRRRVVLIGTCVEYDVSDPSLHDGDCREDATPLRPHTFYGVAKKTLGELARAYTEVSNLSLAWTRPFFLYGPDEPAGKLIASVLRTLRDGGVAETTHGRQIRDYIHVADAADVHARLLLAADTGAFNVGTGRATTVREVVEAAARAAGRPDAIALGARQAPPDEPPRIVADLTRLRAALPDWRPRFAIDAGVADCLARLDRSRAAATR